MNESAEKFLSVAYREDQEQVLPPALEKYLEHYIGEKIN